MEELLAYAYLLEMDLIPETVYEEKRNELYKFIITKERMYIWDL